MIGEEDNFVTFKKFQRNFDDTNSESYGSLENRTLPAGQQQQQGGRYVTSHDYEEGSPEPIKTTMKTKYTFSGGDQRGFENNECFKIAPRTQQLPNFQPVLSYRAFGKATEKPNIDIFRTAMLQEHNIYRAKHCADPLKLNDDLNQQAQKWADHLADLNCIEYCDADGYGETIYWFDSCGSKMYPTAENVCEKWYSEQKNYIFGQNPGRNQPHVTEFTQMVWKLSTDLGVGMAKAGDGAVYVVANYSPRGNIDGQFASNVFPCTVQN